MEKKYLFMKILTKEFFKDYQFLREKKPEISALGN